MSSEATVGALPAGLALRVVGLTKRYRLDRIDAPADSLRDALARAASLRWLQPAPASAEVAAVDGVSFDIERGERVALLGGNGAGKSTLLRMIARVTTPSAGWAAVRGRVATMLEVGTGFHPELSGRENVFLNGAILGMDRREIATRLPAIAAFADIGAAFDVAVKQYSSGMYARLAFSVAAHLDASVLLVDEVLAVGDAAFRGKCLDHLERHLAGRTLVFVSHDLDLVRRTCSRALVLAGGRVVHDGGVEPAIARLQRETGAAPDGA